MGIKLEAQPFIDEASRTSDLEDFGGRSFEAGLNALINSLNTDLDLQEGTASYFQQVIYQLLVNRLKVIQLIKDHPDILDEKIEAPVFIVGLPRSGTTITQTLMALDPMSRYLRNYETAGALYPPPGLMPQTPDPRIQVFHEAMEGILALNPELRGINGINFMALGTAECQNLMAHEFVHAGWSAGSSLFGYGDWVSECDMAPAYQWHKRLLQVLQWRLPNEHWVLKAPIHLFGLDSLLEIYPDARIVFTHRNPFEAMVSGVSMVVHWTRCTTGQVNIPAIAQWYPALWAKGLERALAVRKRLKPDRLVDLYHGDICQEAVSTIETVYDFFGLSFNQAARKRMQVWLRDNPRSKFGRHTCDANQLGLEIDRENARFAFYLNQFDV